METPSSSTRRVTRSKTLASLNNSIPISKGKNEESVSKSRTRNGKQQQQERSALIDITNDSPIVGLAMGTPSSDTSKKWRGKNMAVMMTPGSGEALLKGQVKTLLQKVEEEAELSKVSFESRRPFLHLQSPMGLMAPTPANTPQVEDGSISGLGSILMTLPAVEEKLRVSEVVSGIFDGVSLESQKSMITRSLLLDFSEKSDSTECDSESVVTDEGLITGESSANKEKGSPDDDNSSVWSIQVNASTHDEEEEEEAIEEMGDDYYEDEEEEEEGGSVDELCEGLSKMSMIEMFKGKHTRFVYNSDDEIEGECAEIEMFKGKHTRFVYNSDDEIEGECAEIEKESYDIIRLKGLPTPKGKHLRFALDDN